MTQLEVKALNKFEWAQLSEGAHRATFGEFRPKEFERIDFALVVHDNSKEQKPVTYVTCSELNAEILMVKFGGAFPWAKGSILVSAAHKLTENFIREKGWLHITTLVKNDNVPALKLHLAKGFRIIGVQHFCGETLVELHKDLREDF